MKAVILRHTGSPDVLRVEEVPVPKVVPGWVLVKVMAFGLNRSELIMREYEGDAPYIKLPRILGIECVGAVEDGSDTRFKKGQRVVALMGGMGRSFDGSYAEYALLPEKNVFSVDSDLSWEELAAIPETYFTAYGSLFWSLRLEPTDLLLVRGGTSSAGLAAIQLAKSVGARVIATTRSELKRAILEKQGADHVLVEDGTISEQLFGKFPKGVDKILELIGPLTLMESMEMLKPHGIVCVTGILGKKATIDNFYPIKDIPSGAYLTGFVSNNPNQGIIDEMFALIQKHGLHPVISRIFPLEGIVDAHILMESNSANGKLVIVP